MASKSIHQQIRYIKDDVKNRADKMATRIAYEAAMDLVATHTSIMTDFYTYSPNSYRRTGNLRNNSLIPQITPRKEGETWKAGITVGSFRMANIYGKGATPDNIFNLMWMKGIRGLPKVGSEILSHSWTWKDGYHDYMENPRKWENPYWSGESKPYENVFKTNMKIGSKTTPNGTPHQVMCSVISLWGNDRGKEICDKYARYF